MNDYEEKYKQALERASKLRVHNPFDTVGQMVEHIFPELKESEDERIKREILELVSIAGNGNQFEEIKDWLEKQKNTQDKEYVFRPFAGEAIEKAAERAVELDGKVVLAFNGAYIPVGNKTKDEIVAEYNSWLEKQGERKPYGQRKECSDCQFNYAGECKGYCALKRNECKPTDKVEPKFKVGDLIILPLGIIARIDSINSTDYQVTTTDGKICDFKISKQDNYRLWSITDAKDGDLIYVSTEEKGIQATFHEYKNDIIFFHCYLCTDFVQGGYMPIGSVELIYPLQKTHYNRFFEKMHEAGYEWDSKNKELKKNL